MDPEPRQSAPLALQLRDRALKAYVTCLGLGLIPKGSGTWASAVAVIFWMGLHLAGVSSLLFCSLILIFFVLGVWSVRLYEQVTESEDASEIVIDEWVGMGISLVLVEGDWILALAAFVLFRFFDIVKPLGIRWFDRNYMEGWGVMLDDVAAGLASAIVIGVLKWLQFSDILVSKL